MSMQLENQSLIFVCQNAKHKQQVLKNIKALGIPLSLPDPPNLPHELDSNLGLAYWAPNREGNYGEGIMSVDTTNLSRHWNIIESFLAYKPILEEYADRRHTRPDTAYYTKAQIEELKLIIGPAGKSYGGEVLRNFFSQIVEQGKQFKLIE